MPDFRQKTHVGLASILSMGLIVGLAVAFLPGGRARFFASTDGWAQDLAPVQPFAGVRMPADDSQPEQVVEAAPVRPAAGTTVRSFNLETMQFYNRLARFPLYSKSYASATMDRCIVAKAPKAGMPSKAPKRSIAAFFPFNAPLPLRKVICHA